MNKRRNLEKRKETFSKNKSRWTISERRIRRNSPLKSPQSCSNQRTRWEVDEEPRSKRLKMALENTKHSQNETRMKNHSRDAWSSWNRHVESKLYEHPIKNISVQSIKSQLHPVTLIERHLRDDGTNFRSKTLSAVALTFAGNLPHTSFTAKSHCSLKASTTSGATVLEWLEDQS